MKITFNSKKILKFLFVILLIWGCISCLMTPNVVEGMKRVKKTAEQEAAFQANRSALIAAGNQQYFQGNAKLAAAAAANDAAASAINAASAVKIPSNTIQTQLANQFKW